MVQRQQAIEDELDLTKNQASSQLDAEPSQETPTSAADSLQEGDASEGYPQ